MPSCKICQGPTNALYTISNINYEYCSVCNFLQNFYWEDQGKKNESQAAINDEARADRWPAGEREYMYEVGWNLLELMGWPIAWQSRKIHSALRLLPGYDRLVRSFIKRKFRKLLDFGCGHGVAMLELRRKDNIDIVGLDPYTPVKSPSIIREHLLDHRFEANSFDGILSIETMEHMTHVLEIFAELHRILRAGGVLLVQTRRLEDPDYAHEHEKWFYLKDPKTHVAIYSERAMQVIAEKVGFSSVRFRGERYARFVK